MKYYLLPQKCPECNKDFDMLLKIDEFRWSSILFATARGVHCRTRWILKLSAADLRFIHQWSRFQGRKSDPKIHVEE